MSNGFYIFRKCYHEVGQQMLRRFGRLLLYRLLCKFAVKCNSASRSSVRSERIWLCCIDALYNAMLYVWSNSVSNTKLVGGLGGKTRTKVIRLQAEHATENAAAAFFFRKCKRLCDVSIHDRPTDRPPVPPQAVVSCQRARPSALSSRRSAEHTHCSAGFGE